MVIIVTQEDIDSGVKRACNLCPVARAAERVFKHVVSVGTFALHVYYDAHTEAFELPFVARQFVRDFDLGVTVEPLEFEL